MRWPPARTTPTAWIKSARPHQPTNGHSRSRAQVKTSTSPSMAVTVRLTTDIVCMSRGMALLGSNQERIGAHPNARFITTSFSGSLQFQPNLNERPKRGPWYIWEIHVSGDAHLTVFANIAQHGAGRRPAGVA
jgi:hypothetical protein